MDEIINIDGFLREQYDIARHGMNENEKDDWFKNHDGKITKINAAITDLPYLAKAAYEKQYYSDTYRVIYEKGIGELQKSAKHPDLFRANVVEYGTNNHVTGQAELMKLSPDTVMQVSDAALGVFRIASIATNQYFMARIDSKLSGIADDTEEIKRFLTLDKESRLVAEYDYTVRLLQKLNYIESDNVYRVSVLNKAQDIKIDSLQNINFYSAELEYLKLDKKDKDGEIEKNLKILSRDFSDLWLSLVLYCLSSYLEARLSGITDKDYIDEYIKDIIVKVQNYKSCYNKHYHNLRDYINKLRRLKDTELWAVLSKIAEMGSYTSIWNILPGTALKYASDFFDKKDHDNKKKKKEDYLDQINKLLDPYRHFEKMELCINGLIALRDINNNTVELMCDKGNYYLSVDNTTNLNDLYMELNQQEKEKVAA